MKRKKEVNNKQYKDDSFLNRLSSFLYHYGGVRVKKIVQFKEKVFYIQTIENKAFILKGKTSKHLLLQQAEFFNSIEAEFVNKFKLFPNGKRIIEGFGLYWTWIPYIEGKELDFSKHLDRKDAANTVKRFHIESKGIKIENPVIRQPLYIKFYNRMEKLERTKAIMENYGFLNLFHDIKKFMKERLFLFGQLDWHSIEKKSVDHWQWVHGDVASHNFIRSKDNVHLIDFDLLSLSPSIYDYIQLGQRFLPFIDWKMDHLLTYLPLEKEEDLKTCLLGIAVPSDVIREWWYFTMENHPGQENRKYLQLLSERWTLRKQFVDDIEFMLR